MKRIVYLIALGLVLAGIVHIVVVLTVPRFAERDAWAKLSDRGTMWNFTAVARPGREDSLLADTDPAFGVLACRFDLSEAPLSVTAGGTLPFWSVAIFDRRGRNVYSFNDRTAIERTLFLIVVTPVQMARLRKNPPEEIEQAVLVEAPIGEGFVLVRALQSDPSWSTRVRRFMEEAKCEKFDLPEDAIGNGERTIEDVDENGEPLG